LPWRPADLLNTGLLVFAVFLLMRQQYSAALGSTPITAVSMASPRWSQPAPVEAAAATPAVPDCPSAPPPSVAPPLARAIAATAATAAAADTLRYSTDEVRLKQLWRHPKVKHPEWWKEVHHDWWAFLDRRQLARGVAAAGDPARLECLAEKLLDGHGVKLGIIGGSVSFGTTFTTSKSHALYHWKLYQWLNASFPPADRRVSDHEHYCGAVPASGPSYMEHCLQWHVPKDVDLIIIEYAVNFDTSSEDDAHSFERMLRRLLRTPGAPAVVVLNTMELMPTSGHVGIDWNRKGPIDWNKLFFSGCTAYGCRAAPAWSDTTDLGFAWRAPAEDDIVALAQYYAVPCVSLRAALFPELKQNSSRFPLKQLFHDRHHPAAWGHSLMAQMLASRIGDAVAAVAARRAAAAARGDGATPVSQCGAVAAELAAAGAAEGAAAGAAAVSSGAAAGGVAMLGAPLLSKTLEASVGLCLKGDELTRAMLNTSTFRFKVEGTDAKMKPGIIGTQPGEHAEFCLDVARLEPGEGFAALLGHLVSYEHMGRARVTCWGECSCLPTDIDAYVKGGKFSVFKAHVLDLKRVAQPRGSPSPPRKEGCGCVLRTQILAQSGSGEYKFKVLSLMTAAKRGELKWGHQAGFNVRPTEARTGATEHI